MVRVMSDEESQEYRERFHRFLDERKVDVSCEVSEIPDDNLEMILAGMLYQYEQHLNTHKYVTENMPDRKDWADLELLRAMEYGAILNAVAEKLRKI